ARRTHDPNLLRHSRTAFFEGARLCITEGFEYRRLCGYPTFVLSSELLRVVTKDERILGGGRLLLVRSAKRPAHRAEESFLIKRLDKKGESSGRHYGCFRGRILVAGDEDDTRL